CFMSLGRFCRSSSSVLMRCPRYGASNLSSCARSLSKRRCAAGCMWILGMRCHQRLATSSAMQRACSRGAQGRQRARARCSRRIARVERVNLRDVITLLIVVAAASVMLFQLLGFAVNLVYPDSDPGELISVVGAGATASPGEVTPPIRLGMRS